MIFGKKYDIIHVTNPNKTLQNIVNENNLSDRLLEYTAATFPNYNDNSVLNGISTNTIKTAITDSYHNAYKLYDGGSTTAIKEIIIGVIST